MKGSDYKIFTGNAFPELAQEIAGILGKKLGDVVVKRFSDGEVSVRLNETVRGYDCYIIQPTCAPVNDNLMEILVMIDAMKRSSANSINVVMPYYGYARQDRQAKPRDPITSKLVALMLETAGANRVVTMDLHAAQIQGYFEIPVDHLYGMPILVDYWKKKNIEDLVVVAPDHGSVVRARTMAEPLNAPIAIIDKRRPEPNKCEIMNIIGDVEGKNCIIVDDMIDTAGTICNAGQALMDLGAKSVVACATHAVLSGPAKQRLNDSAFKQVILLNTIPITEEKMITKFEVISVGPLFAEAIKRIQNREAIGALRTVEE